MYLCTCVCVRTKYVHSLSRKTAFGRSERNRISLHKLWTFYFRSRALHKFRAQQQQPQWHCFQFCFVKLCAYTACDCNFITIYCCLAKELHFLVTHTPWRTTQSWYLFNAYMCVCVRISFACMFVCFSSESKRIRVSNCWFKPYFILVCTYMRILPANNYK